MIVKYGDRFKHNKPTTDKDLSLQTLQKSQLQFSKSNMPPVQMC